MSMLRERIESLYEEGLGSYQAEMKLGVSTGTIKHQYPDLYERFAKRRRLFELQRDALIIETWVAMRFPSYKWVSRKLGVTNDMVSKATTKYFAIPKERGITITLKSKV